LPLVDSLAGDSVAERMARHSGKFASVSLRPAKTISGPADFALIACRTMHIRKCREFSGIRHRHGAC
jgi:hypothetical protein